MCTHTDFLLLRNKVKNVTALFSRFTRVPRRSPRERAGTSREYSAANERARTRRWTSQRRKMSRASCGNGGVVKGDYCADNESDLRKGPRPVLNWPASPELFVLFFLSFFFFFLSIVSSRLPPTKMRDTRRGRSVLEESKEAAELTGFRARNFPLCTTPDKGRGLRIRWRCTLGADLPPSPPRIPLCIPRRSPNWIRGVIEIACESSRAIYLGSA